MHIGAIEHKFRIQRDRAPQEILLRLNIDGHFWTDWELQLIYGKNCNISLYVVSPWQ